MAEAQVPAVAADGTPITLPKSKVPELLEQDNTRLLSPKEATQVRQDIAADTKKSTEGDITTEGVAETWLAGLHGAERGVAGAFGVPLDAGIKGVAELFGGAEAGKKTADYLKRLEEDHPYASGWMEAMGGAQGAIGASELVGAPGRLSQGLVPGAGGLAARAAYGGVENVVQSTTRDINEDAIGRASTNGEKLWANAPKHFVVGAGLTLAGEGLARAVESGVGALAKRGVPALEERAAGALGREVGVEGEAGVAAGQRVRQAAGGEVPKTRGALMEVLEGERTKLRGEAATAHAARVGELETDHIVQAAKQAERTNAGRARVAQEGRIAVEDAERGIADRAIARRAEVSAEAAEMRGRYEELRTTLKGERTTAEDTISRLNAERKKAAQELHELTQTHNADKYDIDETADLIAGFMGRGDDPNFKWAIAPSLEREATRAMEGASASAQTEIQRLSSLHSSLEHAHGLALNHLDDVKRVEGTIDGVFNQEIARISKSAELDIKGIAKAGEREVSSVRKAADASGPKFDKAAAKEEAALERAQAKEIRGLGRPETKTEVDPLIAGAKRSAAEAAGKPAFGPVAGLGAVWSMLHGHPLGGAASLIGGLVAGRARANGNLLTASTLAGVASKLRTVDKAVQDGAASVFGKVASRAAMAEERIRDGKATEIPVKKRAPSFDEVSESLLAAHANPDLIRRHVEAQHGPIVQGAPQTYASVLDASMRAQHFLMAMLPMKQRDPNSLRPDLTESDVSPTEKYDFMQYVGALSDPLDVFKDVRDGTVTEQQVEAIRNVIPELYAQMQQEVMWQNQSLTKPLPYEKEIHLGTLLGVNTDQVLDPEFQALQKDTFVMKEDAGAPVGSKAPGGDAKVAKNMMSASQEAEKGGD